jgi:RNAse (barnase) inhibitor barstar
MILESMVNGELPPGRYRLSAPIAVRALRDELSTAGWTMCLVDGAAMTDRASMFDDFAAACDFPGWFGRNWDAFADCLSDLSWLPERPVAVCWQRSGVFAARNPEIWRMAGEVIDTAIEDREAAGLPALYVIYPAALSDGGGPALRPVR